MPSSRAATSRFVAIVVLPMPPFRPATTTRCAGMRGGFKWSTQHLDQGGCGGPSKAAFGSVRARRVAVPGPPLRGAAGGSAPVLGVDRGGAPGRGRRGWGRGGGRPGGTVGSGGGGGAPAPPPRGLGA